MNSSINNYLPQEKERVQALLSYGALNSLPLIDLDEITKSASITFDVPISAIGLTEHTSMAFKSKVGITEDTCDRDVAFCKYTIEGVDLLVLEDSLSDERFKNNSMVMGFPYIRFYVGISLLTPSEIKIGTLFVADTKPRSFNEDQKFLLKAMANQVISYLELRRHKEELNIILEKPNRLFKAKEEFLNNMSHELRTPLNSISGFVEILSKTILDNKQKESLKIIKSSIEILISIVNDIVDYSKIESGSLKIENKPFNLKKFLNRMFKLHKIKAQEKNLQSEFNVDKNIPSYINGDKVLLNQILKNILGNVIKFTGSGYIKLNVDKVNQSDGEIEIKFSVQDTGIGIPQDKIDFIFDRYEQVEGNTRVYGGTGLGLSISNKLVELQHGKLNVQSELGKGSEFNFSLNYQISNEEEIAELLNKVKEKESFLIRDLRDKRILLAEDNIINVKLIEKVFEATGAHLDVSENGKICVEKLKKSTYDLVLMDLFMPVMDGYEATRYIRNTLKLDIPIIALSANISELNKEKCLKEGMNDYISKPFKSKDLFSSILRSLSYRKCIELPAKLFNLDEGSGELSFDYVGKKKEPIDKLSSKKRSNYKSSKSLNAQDLKSFKECFDYNTFKEYSNNDKIFEQSLIQMFLKEIPEYFKVLEFQIKSKNFLEIKKAAHKLKSPLGMFGYKIIIQQLNEIEEFCELEENEIIVNLYLESKQTLDYIMKDMKTIQDSYLNSETCKNIEL